MLNRISDKQLWLWYWDKRLSGEQIAQMLGCTKAAVSMRMKASGIPTRSVHDYPPTEKQKEAWRKNGKKLSTYPATKAARIKNGKARIGSRKRSDYEFGGHEKRRTDGYVVAFVPDHPHATAEGYVAKHTLIMERSIGRFLREDEVVHHINHIRDDNRLENLRLMTRKEHQSMHMKERHAERRNQVC